MTGQNGHIQEPDQAAPWDGLETRVKESKQEQQLRYWGERWL